MAPLRRLRAAVDALAPAPATAQPLRTPNNPHGDEKYTQVATDVRGQGPPLEGPAVAISAEERAANAIEPAKVAEIAANFLRDGFAIVHGLMDHELLDRIEAKLDNDAAHQILARVLSDRHTEKRSAREVRHIQHALPRTAAWTFPAVVANPLIEQLAGGLLGGSSFIRYMNGNTKFPELSDVEESFAVQNLHMDGAGWSVNSEAEALAHNIEWPHTPMKLFCHIATETITPHNGSTVRPNRLLKQLH